MNTLPQNIKGLLFDFDGVLGQTMEDNYIAWAVALRSVEVQVDRHEYFLLEGYSTYKVAEIFLTQAGASLQLIPQIVQLKEAHYLKHRQFSFYPGVEGLITDLSKTLFSLAIVTGAGRFRLKGLNIEGFLSHFTTIVTGDDTKHCKPAPDPYLTGAKYLGLAPQDCLVIENAPLGIQAAKAAGMACIAISSTLQPEFLKQADLVVPSFLELSRHLKNLLD